MFILTQNDVKRASLVQGCLHQQYVDVLLDVSYGFPVQFPMKNDDCFRGTEGIK